jgi:uncharacterized protein with LGFP repeats
MERGPALLVPADEGYVGPYDGRGAAVTRPRNLVAVLGAALVALGIMVLPVTGSSSTSVAQAADMSQFKAGNIITDQLFFDGSAMSAASVQTFLNVRNPSCVAGPMPCLKSYRQTTPTRAASASCPGTYAGASNETAATIITKVGLACGISQRVLLVILQKEEGLVMATGSSLSTGRYRSAMGFGCPDTAACDSTYYGFFNQVYAAAAQYRKYAAKPLGYSHHAGMVNNILYNPSASCGSSAVYIANQATAGLYNYTPYQPNAAALAAGSGSGNTCSAYGNRNFWIYFTNWFGSTQTAGAGALVDLYVSTGGAGGYLGSVTNAVRCGLRAGGCLQGYVGGSIYWSPTAGARVVRNGPIKDLWASTGYEVGSLGYPTSSTGTTADGVGSYQHFENGSIFWSPTTGARVVSGAMRTVWAAGGYERGPLGYPITGTGTTADGVGRYQHYQKGSIFWSPTTGAQAVSGAVKTLWASTAYEKGPLGYPTNSTSPTGDGAGQYEHFQKGSIFWSSTTGAQAVVGPIKTLWASTAYEKGPLGYPTTSTAATADGTGSFSVFEGGRIYWSAATGAHSVSGPIAARWLTEGAEQGALGYPTTSVVTGADGLGQYANFQHGSIADVPGSPAHEVTGPIRDRWVATGADKGLGYPTSDETVNGDGVGKVVSFQSGSIFWSPSTGAHVMSGPIGAAWTTAGAEEGPLGYPMSDPSPTGDGLGRYQQFAQGWIFWSPTTGARTVMGQIKDLWASTGYERGPLGYPTTSTGPTGDGVGRYEHFQKGSIFWSPSTGARLSSGPVLTLWASTGYERGALGYPTNSAGPTGDGVGRYEHFQKGSVFWSPTTGAHSVRGAFRTAWAATGYERGHLGYPTKDAYAVAGGSRVDFQHGYITVATSTGKVAVVFR